jgi:hypothetical protein
VTSLAHRLLSGLDIVEVTIDPGRQPDGTIIGFKGKDKSALPHQFRLRLQGLGTNAFVALRKHLHDQLWN